MSTPTLSLDLSDSYVPYARRRNTPEQLHALHELFETTPHPTRAQRQALADKIGMEIKSVTNWFQNRRQTSRRKFLSFNENNPIKTRLPHSPARHRHLRSKIPLDRSKISLDRIAALSERPSLTSELNSHRLPLTPRKGNVQRKDPSSPSELWTHMLSSPTVPPSPDTEEARLSVLPSRAKIRFPLDWACLKARQRKWVDEDADELSMHLVPRSYREVEEDRTEPAVANVESGVAVSLHNDASSSNRDHFLFTRPTLKPQVEDVEAAITLLGFKTRL